MPGAAVPAVSLRIDLEVCRGERRSPSRTQASTQAPLSLLASRNAEEERKKLTAPLIIPLPQAAFREKKKKKKKKINTRVYP